jgi:uncharacterized protein (TIGR02271 family)
MTMHAEELIGAQVTGGDGQVVGTVEQVFNDDADGRPVWALVRAGKKDKFVPLGGGRFSKDGLSVPFDTKLIMSSPDVDAGRHMSAAQADQLNRHFGLTVPQQAGQPDVPAQGQQDTSGRTGQQDVSGRAGQQDTRGGQQDMRGGQQDRSAQAGQQDVSGRAGQQDMRGGQQDRSAQAGQQDRDGQLTSEWLTRTEERVDVGVETLETGTARLHKYVDTEPVEQAVHVYHEEVEIERVPVTPEEQANGGSITEDQKEVILHQQRAVFRKEAVPVERVRLVVHRVEEDKTFRDEIRKERIEIESDGGTAPAAGGSQRPSSNR